MSISVGLGLKSLNKYSLLLLLTVVDEFLIRLGYSSGCSFHHVIGRNKISLGCCLEGRLVVWTSKGLGNPRTIEDKDRVALFEGITFGSLLHVEGCSKIFAAGRFEGGSKSVVFDFTDTIDQLCIFNSKIIAHVSYSSRSCLFHDLVAVIGVTIQLGTE